MTTFTVGDPVVLLADLDSDTNPLTDFIGGRLGTVVHDNYATDTLTICDDTTGRIYDAPYEKVAYPEGTPLHSTRFFDLLAIIPRRETQQPGWPHMTQFDRGGVIDQLPTGHLSYAGHRPRIIGKRIFAAGAPVVHVPGDWDGTADVVRSHHDVTTVRLDDGELRAVNTKDLAYPAGLTVQTRHQHDVTKDPIRQPVPWDNGGGVHLTDTTHGYVPTSDLIVTDPTSDDR
ncbi:hypothetical protein [Curtobacterium sp. MCSS17_016]|uniref:hypothetical protein n=1 Tax=Curtobacterium sp. MCSS17_016 TaxID=2175644 RepID=UPI000DA9E4ED|nr:hypothetical protein [Curtobacterium sp. MCSS17_016]WIE81036.1 hypothetical protein DEJ19_021200 [Curtobacterium sp. MCSS17_016]